jgi:hypothetical protein
MPPLECVADEIEEIVRSNRRDGDERRLIADGGTHESVAAAPEEPIAKLVGFHRFAHPARQDENELIGGKEAVGIGLGSVDRARRLREPPEPGQTPPGVRAERPHASTCEIFDAGHQERRVESERVVGHEQSASTWKALDPGNFDLKERSGSVERAE